MQILPLVALAGPALGVPLNDSAAAALAEVWLCAEPERRKLWLDELLRREPTMALWALSSVAGPNHEPPRGIAQLVRQLDAEGPGMLRVGGELAELARREPDLPEIERWAQLAALSISVAERAAIAAPGHLRETAYLLGLLHAADRWPVAHQAPRDIGPEWLQKFLRILATPAPMPRGGNAVSELELLAGVVRQAIEDQAEGSDERNRPAGAEAHDAESNAGRSTTATAAARQWLASSPRWGTWLHSLAAKLRQMRVLESRFATAVEEAKLVALKEFAYGASHEINNPLANISTRAQTLLREERDPERRRKLATIHSQAMRAHEMIADLMLFARPPVINPQPILLSGVVNRVLAELTEWAEAQGTRLLYQPADGELQVLADFTQLAVALKSLCANSLEALASGGWIEVTTRLAPMEGDVAATTAPLAEIVVRDNGPGVPSDLRDRLFDPYFSGREAGRGLGLGLSKCWRIVTLHGGSIDVASDSTGTCFTIRLPLPGVSARRLEQALAGLAD